MIAELQPPSELKKFTGNTDVVGAYIEAAVRALVRRHVAPLQVSSGAVIDQANVPGDPRLPQIDTIIWAPSPAPAVFQVGEFGLVPRSSTFGVLEIKASAYNLAKLDRRLTAECIKKVTADRSEEERKRVGDFVAGLGVICVRMANQSRSGLEKMRNASRVVVLFEEEADQYRPRPTDIYRLINFLAFMRLRGRLHEGEVYINTDLLRP
jgi:hypothetical protein